MGINRARRPIPRVYVLGVGESVFNCSRTLYAISQCRLVVTAGYHGAIVALGLGIPAACLFKTGSC